MAALKCWRLYEVGTNGKGEVCLTLAGSVSDVADIRVRVSDGMVMAGRRFVDGSSGYRTGKRDGIKYTAAGTVGINRLLSLEPGAVCHANGTKPTNEECHLWYEHPEQFSNRLGDE